MPAVAKTSWTALKCSIFCQLVNRFANLITSFIYLSVALNSENIPTNMGGSKSILTPLTFPPFFSAFDLRGVFVPEAEPSHPYVPSRCWRLWYDLPDTKAPMRSCYQFCGFWRQISRTPLCFPLKQHFPLSTHTIRKSSRKSNHGK